MIGRLPKWRGNVVVFGTGVARLMATSGAVDNIRTCFGVCIDVWTSMALVALPFLEASWHDEQLGNGDVLVRIADGRGGCSIGLVLTMALL